MALLWDRRGFISVSPRNAVVHGEDRGAAGIGLVFGGCDEGLAVVRNRPVSDEASAEFGLLIGVDGATVKMKGLLRGRLATPEPCPGRRPVSRILF